MLICIGTTLGFTRTRIFIEDLLEIKVQLQLNLELKELLLFPLGNIVRFPNFDGHAL